MQSFYSLRDRYNSVANQNSRKALNMREGMIRQEIDKIKRKDAEARKLEKAEERILRRLKEAHLLQKDTIHHIQSVFKSLDSSMDRQGPYEGMMGS